jgi:hypothetical protein
MRNPSRRSLPLLVTLAACAVAGVVACAPQQPPPPPPVPPPAPRALTVYPERNQSQAQQNKDQAQCQNTAAVQATSSESWAYIFTACMSGRGYGVH